MKAIILAAALILSSGAAQAAVWDRIKNYLGDAWNRAISAPVPKNYGDWYCPECSILKAGEVATPNTIIADITISIEFNNDQIHEGEGINTRWVPNSTITVCDGSRCLTMFYHASGKWFPKPPGYSQEDGGREKHISKRGQSGASLNIPQVGFVGADWTGNNVIWITMTIAPRVLTPSITVTMVDPDGDGTPTTTYQGFVDAFQNAPGQDLHNLEPGTYPEFIDDGSGGGGGGCSGGPWDPWWGLGSGQLGMIAIGGC